MMKEVLQYCFNLQIFLCLHSTQEQQTISEHKFTASTALSLAQKYNDDTLPEVDQLNKVSSFGFNES
jgi:hypothetical protein